MIRIASKTQGLDLLKTNLQQKIRLQTSSFCVQLWKVVLQAANVLLQSTLSLDLIV